MGSFGLLETRTRHMKALGPRKSKRVPSGPECRPLPSWTLGSEVWASVFYSFHGAIAILEVYQGSALSSLGSGRTPCTLGVIAASRVDPIIQATSVSMPCNPTFTNT